MTSLRGAVVLAALIILASFGIAFAVSFEGGGVVQTFATSQSDSTNPHRIEYGTEAVDLSVTPDLRQPSHLIIRYTATVSAANAGQAAIRCSVDGTPCEPSFRYIFAHSGWEETHTASWIAEGVAPGTHTIQILVRARVGSTSLHSRALTVEAVSTGVPVLAVSEFGTTAGLMATIGAASYLVVQKLSKKNNGKEK